MILDWTLGCRQRPNEEEPKGFKARDTHMKENPTFKAGVADAHRSQALSDHLA